MLTDAERWQAIVDIQPTLYSICNRAIARANCTTLTAGELLSELLPMCLHWLQKYDAQIGSVEDYLSVSVRLKAKTIIRDHIQHNGRNVPIDSISETQHPSYTQSTTGQDGEQSVLAMVENLPPRQAQLVKAMLAGKSLRQFSRDTGTVKNVVDAEWQRAKHTLAMLLRNRQAHRNSTS